MSLENDYREYFKDHKVTVIENTPNIQMFKCGKPSENNMSFTVVFSDNCIAMSGDIGEVMTCPGYRRGIRWFRGSINSTDYFIEKIPRNLKTTEWNSEKAIKYMRDMIDGMVVETADDWTKGQYYELMGDIDDDTINSSEKFYEKWSDLRLDDPPNIEVITKRLWIQISAFTWLAEQLDEMDFKVAERMLTLDKEVSNL